MIMNRLGLENYTEQLREGMDFQTSDQIVIYTSPTSGGILGIWIYEEADRVRIPEQLSKCCSNASSAKLVEGMQILYPRNAEEESEFQRMYPRSHSNSRKGGSMEQANANALASMINRVRQQQQQQQQEASGMAPDLVSKLQAIGLGPTNGAGPQVLNGSSHAAQALPDDPAIILARKSVNPQEMSRGNCKAAEPEEPSSFKSPLSVPSAHAAQRPSSPALHPAASPFPPSTIATPLPGHGPPGVSPMAMQQPAFWHMHGGRSTHASPAPPSYGPVPGMFGFPQVPQAAMGMPQAAPAPVTASGPPPGSAPGSVAHNLAEQLVSLVRQRMNSAHSGSAESTPMQGRADPGTTKLQRDYCREWLIRVIQTDDELVDAFARRFPPPIFGPQQQQ
ncbi:hypothetical protein LPJ78_000295 [Coemansia sp. RSA 989]|nr:hypothetical protein LPJ79_004770 [Coemansia sp. RSA 1821]KAJ1868357.1 hypothetical protein LPJ78_000295 [Coemansia sp. RSA 989]